MKAKRGLFLLLALLFCLAGCDTPGGSTGYALTVPLDRIIEAVETGNRGLYESAFPTDFPVQYRMQSGEYAKTLSDLLAAAAEKNRKDLGDTWSIRYELTGSKRLEITLLERYYGYTGLDPFRYTMPLEYISDFREITVTVYFEGSFDSFEKELTYRVLCIEGLWYLHPESFGTVLRSQTP